MNREELIALFLLNVNRLNGSSAASETYGNACLARSEDFVVKEVEVCPINVLAYSSICLNSGMKQTYINQNLVSSSVMGLCLSFEI